MKALQSRKRDRIRLSPALPTSSDMASKEAILSSAEKLFASRGFAGTTIRDVCDAAGVNIASISYYFEGKEGLYRACLSRYGDERLALTQRILQPARSLEELRVRLQMFTQEMLESHINNPSVNRILLRECDNGLPVARDIFQNSFLKIHHAFDRFFKAAQKSGLVEPSLDSALVASLYFASLSHFFRSEKTNREYLNLNLADVKGRQKLVDHMVRIFLNGVVCAQPGSAP
jgi:AcrR family transcriptional regulator